MLKASTTVTIATPGATPIHHWLKYCEDSETIEPHSAAGGREPSPRNERPASSRIAPPTSSIASTSTGPTTPGSMSTLIERSEPTPASRLAST